MLFRRLPRQSFTAPRASLSRLVARVTAVVCLLFSGSYLVADTEFVLVLLDGDAAPYQQFKNQIQDRYYSSPSANRIYVFTDIAEHDPQEIRDRANKAKAVVSVGKSSTILAATLGINTRHIATFITQQEYKNIRLGHIKSPENACAITIEQPLDRIIEITQKHLHGVNKVAIIKKSSDSSGDRHNDSRIINNIRVIEEPLAKDIHTTIHNLSSKGVGAIIALYDKEVYNQHTARNILISSYHFNVPLIGYSSAFVKAGAMLGIYSKPEAIANDVYTLITNNSNCNNGEIYYPSIYTVEVNYQVANSLGININPLFREKTYQERP